MFNPFFLFFFVFYIILCAIEFVVFNEEILLALCFFAFLFVFFNIFSTSVFLSLNSRANKFESDFLVVFANNKAVIIDGFFGLVFKKQNLKKKYKVLLLSILVSNNFFWTNQAQFITKCFLVSALFQINILKNTQRFFTLFFQKQFQLQLLYPFVIKKNNLWAQKFEIGNSLHITPNSNVIFLKNNSCF